MATRKQETQNTSRSETLRESEPIVPSLNPVAFAYAPKSIACKYRAMLFLETNPERRVCNCAREEFDRIDKRPQNMTQM